MNTAYEELWANPQGVFECCNNRSVLVALYRLEQQLTAVRSLKTKEEQQTTLKKLNELATLFHDDERTKVLELAPLLLLNYTKFMLDEEVEKVNQMLSTRPCQYMTFADKFRIQQ